MFNALWDLIKKNQKKCKQINFQKFLYINKNKLKTNIIKK